MKPSTCKRPFQCVAALVIGSVLLFMGGCPVDRDAVLEETVRAGLQATLDSFVEALSEYLAAN